MRDVDWATTGTRALAIIAFASFWVQWWFSKATLRAEHETAKKDIAMRFHSQLTERFDSARMHKQRSVLAFQIIGGAPDNEIKEFVMDFFEDLGDLLKDQYLDEQRTYSTFSYYAKCWWFVCKPYIERVRAKKGGDKSFFSAFEGLAARMMELEAKDPNREGAISGIPSDEELREFLDEAYTELSVE